MLNYCVFILSHGRADNVITFKSLRKQGYTGDIIIVIDNEDKSADEYFKRFDKVIVFNKYEISKTFDTADNFNDRRTIVYARNACFDIAKELGYKYFIQMDDDYIQFDYRLYSEENQVPIRVCTLDYVFSIIWEFYMSTEISSVSMAQGGDFIGGKNNKMAKKPTLFRKCMNSFFCSTDRPFQFVGRINEDVNTYTKKQSVGLMVTTIPFVSLTQKMTQKSKGGMTDVYLSSGTYIKSFYSVIFQPSSVTIRPMGDKHMRLHHSINWNNTVPKILSEEHKKTQNKQ